MPDGDADGWTRLTDSVAACDAPPSFLDCSDPTDCDDTRAAVSPDGTEVCGNGLDDDCDGAAGVCPLDASTPADADATYLGDAGDGAGYAVVMLDVDGNGDQDLLVGAPYAEAGPVKTGAVALHTVNPAGRVPAADALGLARGGTSSEWDESNFGAQLAAVGDQDGDGDDEWVTTARGWDGSVGRTDLYLGDVAVPTASAETVDGVAGSYCGTGLVAGTDLSGDGQADWVLGCPSASDSWVSVQDGGVGVTITGAASADEFGWALATDDFDGDGTADLVVLASDGDATYLFLGPLTDGTAADLAADVRSGDADRVATPGDGDGDGLNDLLLARDNRSDAELCFGGTRLLSGASLDLGVAMTAGAGGDLDGDGDVDLVLSDYMDDDYQGIVRIAYGPVTGPPSFATIDSSDQNFFGYSLAIGDLDGDGAVDLAVGAPYDGSGGAYSGAVFVFDGVGF